MAVAISLIVTILENLNGFLRTDKEIIKMAKKRLRQVNFKY